MHLPPAVSYVVVRSRWHFYGLLALGGIGLLSAAAYWSEQPFGMGVALVAGVAGVSIPVAFLAWCRSPCGVLQWDGSQWMWSGFGEASVQRLLVSLDFQFLMLVQICADDGQSVWLFLQECADGERWAALRRALYARAAANRGGAEASNGALDVLR